MKTALLLIGLLIGLPAAAAGRPPDDPASAIRAYYAALEAGDAPSALARCDEAATSRSDCAALAETISGVAHLRVRTGTPRDPEGAAGSVYVKVPVTLRVTGRDGRSRGYAGLHVMRRRNLGADPAQGDHRWRIVSAHLHAVR